MSQSVVLGIADSCCSADVNKTAFRSVAAQTDTQGDAHICAYVYHVCL